MTKMNRPRVSTVAGSVSRISSGRRKAFTSPSTTAAIIAVPKLATAMPGITYATVSSDRALISQAIARRSSILVPVVVRFVRTVFRHTDVLRLLRGELGERGVQLLQLQPRHLFIQVLGQRVDADRVLRRVREQLD